MIAISLVRISHKPKKEFFGPDMRKEFGGVGNGYRKEVKVTAESESAVIL